MNCFTRREFLGLTAASLITACAPRRLAIPSNSFTSDPIRIAFITDLHLVREPFIDDALETFRTKIIAEKPDIILGGGDWISGGNVLTASEARPLFQRAASWMNSLPVKPIIIPGNHDFVDVRRETPDKFLAEYQSAFGGYSTHRAIDFGRATLFAIESHRFTLDEDLYIGEVSKETLVWLRSELSRRDPKQPKILLLHIPLLTLLFQSQDGAMSGAPANRVVTNNREVLNCFEGQNLALVLQGHLHVNEFMKWRETTFITGGALCGKWWAGKNYGTPPGFGIVTLNQSGAEWRYIETCSPAIRCLG